VLSRTCPKLRNLYVTHITKKRTLSCVLYARSQSSVVYQGLNCPPCVSARVTESESRGFEGFGWSRIPKNIRIRSRIKNPKNPSPASEISMNHFLHCTAKIGILTHACWNGTISFETFIETEFMRCTTISTDCYVAAKLLAAKLHSRYDKESVSEILERLESDILPPTPQSRMSVIQANIYSAWLLFDETLAQPDVFAVVKCAIVVLSVFYSAVLILSLIFWSCELQKRWRRPISTECILPVLNHWFYSPV